MGCSFSVLMSGEAAFIKIVARFYLETASFAIHMVRGE